LITTVSFVSLQAAIALFDKAIAADPQNPVAHLNKAVCTLQLTNDVHGAIAQLEKAVKVDPSFGAAITQLGQVHASSISTSNSCAGVMHVVIALDATSTLSMHGSFLYMRFCVVAATL
jgi:tetratricopeptide (TPR) repeat protein